MLSQWLAGKRYEQSNKRGGYLYKKWDSCVPQPAFWEEVFRVLKPGGWVVAFFSSRTYDLGTFAIRLAGFDVRDQIYWMYGSTSPKSHNLGRSIDRKAGVDVKQHYTIKTRNPQTALAKQWIGWGTQLRPLVEPICLARKPLYKNSVVENVLKHKVGALNIEGCRIKDPKVAASKTNLSKSGSRYPVNVIVSKKAKKVIHKQYGDTVSRFFYVPKVKRKERDAGCEALPVKIHDPAAGFVHHIASRRSSDGKKIKPKQVKNNHPTVKPIRLMRYLIRLVAPPGSIVCDPFLGSGTTGIAAIQEGCKFIGMEVSPNYFRIARARMKHFYKEQLQHEA